VGSKVRTIDQQQNEETDEEQTRDDPGWRETAQRGHGMFLVGVRE
jgi:hypothetical protein